MVAQISLRDYRTSDLEAIFRLDQICFSAEFRFDRRSMRRFAEREEAVCVIAEGPGGEIAGFVIADLEKVPVGYVVTLDVAVTWRRQGLAALLLREAERRMCAAGAEWMMLHVFSGNVEAMRFYERLGYERVGEQGGFYGRVGLDAWVYRKPLEPAMSSEG